MTVRHQDAINRGDQAAKAGCYHCLKNTGGLIDTDLIIEGEGRLFICDALGYEIATVLGCASPQETARMKKAISEAMADIKGLREALRDKEQLITEQSAYINAHEHHPKPEIVKPKQAKKKSS